jgi:transposase
MIEAVAERLEGAPRQVRRRWSDGFKAEVVAEASEPGASISAIARRVGIHPSQLFTWRRKALETRQGALQLVDAGPATGPTGRGTIEVVIGDVVVRADADVDALHLQRVIRAVRLA